MDAQLTWETFSALTVSIAPDLLPALAIPAVALIFGVATAVGWSGPDLAARLFGKCAGCG